MIINHNKGATTAYRGISKGKHSRSNTMFSNVISSLINKTGLIPESTDIVYVVDPGGRSRLNNSHDDISLSTTTYFLSPKKSCFSAKDQSLFVQLCRNGSDEISEFNLRETLLELTEDFLHSFTPYLTFDLRPLMLNPFQMMPRPIPFNPTEFLDTLQPKGIFKLLSINKIRRLYREFIGTSTFRNWFQKEFNVKENESLQSQLSLCLSATELTLKKFAKSELEESLVFISDILSSQRNMSESLIESPTSISKTSDSERRLTKLRSEEIVQLTSLSELISEEILQRNNNVRNRESVNSRI